MDIILTFDSSVSSAPAGFTSALEYVVSVLDAAFTNPVTINIDVGWGEVSGTNLSANARRECVRIGYIHLRPD
jgi:hypothetical protein